MQKLKKVGAALGALALLALLVALTPPGRAIAQDARVLLVEVVNTPNVNLNQPITIGNAPANPVPVVSVGLPARQPFLASLFCTDLQGFASCSDTLTVPPAKLLLIETYSANCITSTVTPAVRSTIEIPGLTGNAQFFFPLERSIAGASFAPGRNHAMTSAVRVYADPGTEISFAFRGARPVSA